MRAIALICFVLFVTSACNDPYAFQSMAIRTTVKQSGVIAVTPLAGEWLCPAKGRP